MTKLEELKAAVDSAYDAACDKIDAGLCDDEAEVVFSDRWDDFHDARDAYLTELKKQEENV